MQVQIMNYSDIVDAHKSSMSPDITLANHGSHCTYKTT